MIFTPNLNVPRPEDYGPRGNPLWRQQALLFLMAGIQELHELVNKALECNRRLERVGPPALVTEQPAADVTVTRDGDQFTVRVNTEHIPQLNIGPAQSSAAQSVTPPPGGERARRIELTAARFVIQCLNRRQEAIYKVACEIVRHQRDFFERGLVHLKPLTQGELARRMGFSQTTVTRAVRHKTMQTPYGLMKFESFFSLGYSTADGNRMTIASVKALVAQCIAEEEPCHPLSDVQLAHQLIKKGVPIARRTVGKYRHELGIPRAHLRQAHSNPKQ